MPHQRLYPFRVHVLRDQERRERVAQVVEPHLTSPGTTQRRMKTATQQILRVLDVAMSVRENEFQLAFRTRKAPGFEVVQ